jgi:hypothetical protein
MAGRKSKYTPENIKRILDAIEVGTPYRHAAAIVGISETTFHEWQSKKPEFAESIKAAEGRAVAGRLARIRQAEPTHWQASAWFLERKYPQEFGRTVQEQQISGKDGAPLTVVIERVTS